MADSDQSLDILIRLLSETKGADTVQAALDKTKVAATETSVSTQKLTEATTDGSKAAEKSEISHRALHQILHLIGREAGPEAEAALAGVAAAGTGEILILVLAVHALFEWLDKVKEKSKELAEQNAEVWIKQRDAINDAADEAQRFHDILEKSKQKTDELKNAFAQQNAVLAAQIDGHKKILEALEKEQLAEAKGDKDREEAVKKRFEDLKREYDIAAETRKLEQERNQLAGLKSGQGKLADTAEDLDSELKREKADAAAAAAAARLEGKDEKKLKAAADQAEKELPYQRSVAENPAAFGLGKQEAEFQVQEGEAAIAAFKSYEADAKAVREHTEKVKALTQKVEEAEQKRKANTKAIEEEGNKVNTASDVLNQHRKTAAAEKSISDLERLGGSGAIGPAMEQFAQDKILTEHGGKISAERQKANLALQTFMQEIGFSIGEFNGMIKALAASHAAAASKQEVAELKNYVAAAIARFDRAHQ